MMQLIQEDEDIMEAYDEYVEPEIDIKELSDKLTQFLARRIGKETAEYWTDKLDEELENLYESDMSCIQFILEEIGFEDK